MPLFVATFVVVVEERWFTSPNEPYVSETQRIPDRFDRNYYLQSNLYLASGREQAHEKALSWVDGFEDCNHHGIGDLTAHYSVGIFDIEEVVLGQRPFDQCVADLYGVEVGFISCKDIGKDGIPRIRAKGELSVFQYPPTDSSTDA